MRRLLLAALAAAFLVTLGMLIFASPSARADGVCGELHGETEAHPGHRDGDGDGLVCEGHPAPTPGGYNRAEWQFDSAAARDLLGCDDSEHVDHVVALKEAHDSGGAAWSRERKQTFANDIANLRCLDAGVNIAKSDHDLAEWSGGSCDLRKEIAITTAIIKAVYELQTDLAEEQAIAAAIEADCVALALAELELEVRIAARLTADGRTEFGLQYRAGGGEWTNTLFPRARYMPVTPPLERWLFSSPIWIGR